MDSNGSGEQMLLRERGARKSFYDPSSDEEEDGGSVSDGDPPYMTGPPPPPIAPPPVLPSHSSNEQLPPSSRKGSTAGSAGGSSGPKRNFDELEDIIFSNPRSFVSLAGAIAESRGVQLVISDDRTHKVSSAYMHIICAYRKAGCPLILKLVKAKEGGWMIKGAKAVELDNKQRSCYRCRHPSGARPDVSGATVNDWLNRSTSFPEPGARPKAAKARTASTGSGVGWGGANDDDRDGDYVESVVGKAPRAPLGGRMGGGGAVKSEAADAADRALAPPFQRSIDLQAQIVPALGGRPSPGGPGGGAAASVTYPPGVGGLPRPAPSAYYPTNGSGVLYHSPSSTVHRGLSPPLHHHRAYSSAYPPYDAPLTASPYSAASHSRYPSHASHPPHPTAPSGSISASHPVTPAPPPPPAGAYAPVVAHADPTALPEWTAVLSALGDSTLLPLAKVLGSPFVACTPSEFFSAPSSASSSSAETHRTIQLALLEQLPASSTGLWPKLKLCQLAREGKLQQAWDQVLEERKREGEPSYVSGVRRNTLPGVIPPQGGAAAGGAGVGGKANGVQTAGGRGGRAGSFSATMDVDPSPGGTGAPSPAPLPAAAAANGA